MDLLIQIARHVQSDSYSGGLRIWVYLSGAYFYGELLTEAKYREWLAHDTGFTANPEPDPDFFLYMLVEISSLTGIRTARFLVKDITTWGSRL